MQVARDLSVEASLAGAVALSKGDHSRIFVDIDAHLFI